LSTKCGDHLFGSCESCRSWRKRRYEAAFKSKLNNAEAERPKLNMGRSSATVFYIDKQTADKLDQKYEHILTRLVSMSRDAGN